jgi:hypothetical protein
MEPFFSLRLDSANIHGCYRMRQFKTTRGKRGICVFLQADDGAVEMQGLLDAFSAYARALMYYKP